MNWSPSFGAVRFAASVLNIALLPNKGMTVTYGRAAFTHAECYVFCRYLKIIEESDEKNTAAFSITTSANGLLCRGGKRKMVWKS